MEIVMPFCSKKTKVLGNGNRNAFVPSFVATIGLHGRRTLVLYRFMRPLRPQLPITSSKPA
jgi:hypothetical protein